MTVFFFHQILSTLRSLTMMHHVLFLLITTYSSEAFKILVISPLPARSHSILGDGVVNHLSKAGHEITYITAFPHDKPAVGVREIDVSSNAKLLPESPLNIKSILNKETDIQDETFIIKIMLMLHTKTLEHPSVQKLLEDPNQKFDVIIAEWMYSELYAGISAVYRCPLVWLSTVEPHWKILRLIDEIPNPAYNSDPFSDNLPPFNFIQRLKELGYQIGGLFFQYYYTSRIEYNAYDNLIAPIIRKRAYPVPNFEELRYNASLVLGNSHESLGNAVRLPSNYKGIGGYHIDSNIKPLPADLKKLIENAKNGVIYFSMGSNLKSKLMPDELKQSLLRMFGSLKQTVLWKFEEDLPNRPNNVHILQWAPQQSILNHSNCILFITHGGLLSTTEAVYFAKPIIGIPVFADQFTNIDRAVAKGFAKKVDLSYTMADDIKTAIENVLSDPKYAAKAKELSFIYHDRPVEPGKELVHWVEHVVKTGGALHLRSLAVDVPLYQKLYLDLVGIILTVLYIIKISITLILATMLEKKKQSKTLGLKKRN